MKNIVILGAGTGGTIMANLLSQELNLKEWAITVIDRSNEHHYQPGYLFIPFRLYGYQGRQDVVRGITEKLPKNTRFIQAQIRLIDHANQKIQTNHGDYDYDWLISALGCHVAPAEVEGMAEAIGERVDTFYTLDGALRLQQALDSMASGKLVIDICDMPIKCPVAPIEFAFLADYYFQLKGIRDQIDISLVTPFSGAFTKINANRILSEIAEHKRIHIVPDFSIERVDADNRQIHSFEGETIDYDLLVTIPPNMGPQVIDRSGLGPVQLSFASRAELRPPERIAIRTSERPFRRLEIDWVFEQGQGPGCEVRLSVDLEISAGLLRPMVQGRFESVAARLIPLFMARTEALLQGR